MVNKLILIFIAVLLWGSKIYCQNKVLDSLIILLKSDKEDTNKVIHLNKISWEYKNMSNYKAALHHNNMALQLSKKLFYEIGKANSYAGIGNVFDLKSNYPKALAFYSNALKIFRRMKNKEGIAKLLGNIGVIYYNKSEIPKALEYFLSGLQIDEQIGNKNDVAIDMSNIGSIYMQQNNTSKALEYYLKALSTFRKLGNKYNISGCLNNIGSVNIITGKYEAALENFMEAKKIDEEIGNKAGVAANLSNIGCIYFDQGNEALTNRNKTVAYSEKYPLALKYFILSMNLKEELNDKNGMILGLGNIGHLYTMTGKYHEAEFNLQRALSISEEIGARDYIKNQHQYLSELYDTTNKHKLAYKHYKLYIAYRDSLENDENIKKQTQLEMQYEFDKQHAADSIKNVEKSKQESLKHNQEIKQQQLYTYGGIIGFSLMLVVAVVSFRAFRNKKIANLIIANQKLLVEAKQKEVLDSIHYAKRIQEALLPSEKTISRKLKQLNK